MELKIDQIDIEQLISYEGYEYKLSSGNRGLQVNVRTCPHCHREDYKVYFNAESGLGNCFGCDMKFNKAKFVYYARGLANYSLVNRYLEGIFDRVAVTARPKVVYNPKVNKDWKLPLNRKIELEDDVPEYLINRGIDSKISKRFDLRICDNGFYEYENWSNQKRFVDFSNRVLIPIRDAFGNLVTFQGRDITGKSAKKYLFPNMLPGTARYIYNADFIIRNKIKKVILNEGVFDVFATTKALESEVTHKDWGACGTFGKHFSIQSNTYQAEDQLKDLSLMREAGVEEFVIMWDGEPKAREAALKAALKLRSFDFNATCALGLPDGCDPNECSPTDVLAALETRIVPTALSLLRYRINS